MTANSNKQPQAVQLELASFFTVPGDSYTKTVDVFDLSPKFVFSKNKKTSSLPSIIHRTFSAGNRDWNLSISPALIEDKRTKTTVAMYAGVREEMVVRAIMFLAVQKQGVQVGNSKEDSPVKLSVSASLLEIRNVLKDFGTTYSIQQIAEAIDICVRMRLEYECVQGGISSRAGGGIFSADISQDDLSDETGSRHLRHLTLHPLVTRSILDGGTRAMSFARVIRLESPLARWLYDRINHNFRQASQVGWFSQNGYHISMTTIFAESGFTPSSTGNNLRAIRSALTSLVAANLLCQGKPYTEELRHGPRTSPSGPLPVIDAVWNLFPSATVVDDIIAANSLGTKKR